MTAPSRRIVVFGSVNLDVLVRASRHPGPGETVTGSSLETGLGGKGLNQAVAAARAGADVTMIGAVGDDDAGRAALKALRADGIDVHRVAVRPDVATGHALVTVSDDGENSIVVVPGANGALDAHDAETLLQDLGRGDVLVLQNELPAATSSAAAAVARAVGATVVWNAAPAPVSRGDLPAEVDVLVVNEHELEVVAHLLGIVGDEVGAEGVSGGWVSGGSVSGGAVSGGAVSGGAVSGGAVSGGAVSAPALARLVGRSLSTVVVVTLGSEGSIVVDGERVESVPASRVTVVDTTAAGDTFIGYLVSRLPVDGLAAADLRVAGAAAGLAVTKPGASASIPRRELVDAVLAEAGGSSAS